jgi:hypothetical protein
LPRKYLSKKPATNRVSLKNHQFAKEISQQETGNKPGFSQKSSVCQGNISARNRQQTGFLSKIISLPRKYLSKKPGFYDPRQVEIAPENLPFQHQKLVT